MDIENAEFGLTNSGNDVVKVPVESKEPTLVPESVQKGLEEAKAGKLLDSPEDFSKFVEKKKRGRPKKVLPIREFYCATCREAYLEQALMKMPAGDNRYALFCNVCQKSLGFFQPDVDAKIAKLHKNPSKK